VYWLPHDLHESLLLSCTVCAFAVALPLLLCYIKVKTNEHENKDNLKMAPNAFSFFSEEGSGCVLVQNAPILLFSKT